MPRAKMKLDLKEIERLSSIGLSQRQVCDALGISQDTLTRRKQDDADIADALIRGKAKGIATVACSLFDQAVEGGSVQAASFYLKNRAGWKDKIEQENTGTVHITSSPKDDKCL